MPPKWLTAIIDQLNDREVSDPVLIHA